MMCSPATRSGVIANTTSVFFSLDIQFEKVNADCWPTDFNAFDLVARKAEFRVDIVGFDQHRDIIVVVEEQD